MLEKKKLIIARLRDAKKAHRRWVSNAQTLMQGVPVKNEQLPLKETECGFGRWYYGEGQAFRHYGVFRAIEEPHIALHRIYLQLFDLLFRERKVGFMGRLLGRRAKPSREELDEARQLLPELNAHSTRITELLDELEATIAALDDQAFEKLFS